MSDPDKQESTDAKARELRRTTSADLANMSAEDRAAYLAKGNDVLKDVYHNSEN